MRDVLEIAKMLVADAVEHCGDEISIIAYYGSRARGEETSSSDLDIFYIPVEGADPDAARSFVVSGVAVDFWPITWETAERIADGRFRSWAVAPGIIRNAKVLHARSEEDFARLDALRSRIDEHISEGEARAMTARGLAALPRAERHLEALHRACAHGDAGAIRVCAWLVVTTCLECLALAGQLTFDGGWALAIEEFSRLETSPPDFEDLVRVAVTSGEDQEILAAAERLVADTGRVFEPPRGEPGAPAQDADRFRDSYAEMREHLVKLREACATGDALRASLESWLIRDELDRFAQESAGFRELEIPDPAAAFDADDLDELARVAGEIDLRFTAWLDELGLETNVFVDREELARWLARKRNGGPASS